MSDEASCPYFEECHLKRVENAAGNAELIREIYCCDDPTGCMTYRRLHGVDSKPDIAQ